ncbi:MAG: hypothetical protein ICV64_01965 [Thermoleophilia bacterium]|nr:hypothetical protein [Thermoleophilia bacterium]
MGSLTVVGTGIQLGAQLTPEARVAITEADEVLYVVTDALVALWMERLNPRARSLQDLYAEGVSRRRTYDAMADEIMAAVRRGRDVCAAFYGHPGVFVDPSHVAIRRARAEGYPARMLPAVSAEDCLFADLGVNPGAAGCQSYEATDFLVRRRAVDPSAALVLWQVGIVGRLDLAPEGDRSRLPVLVEYLLEFYPPEHEALLYEAAPYPACDPVIEDVRLADVASAPVGRLATMYVPPSERRRPDAAMLARLGIPETHLR